MKTKTKMKIQNLIKKLAPMVGAAAAILSAVGPTSTAQATADYGPAIWRPAPSGRWYTTGYGKKFYVIHDMEGYYLSTISYLQGNSTSVSVTYCSSGKSDYTGDAPGGEITQMVLDAYYSWTSACWNTRSMSTEHEGFAANPSWYTPAMYDASAALTKSKAEKYGFAKDRNHIVGHGEKATPGWPAWASANLGIDPYCNNHTDPGPYWDWTGYMAKINGPPPAGNLWSVATTRNLDGRMQIFGRGTSGSLRTMWQTAVNGAWSSWLDLGGTIVGVPAAGTNYDGRIQVFCRGTDSKVYTLWQTAPNGNFSTWMLLSGGGSCATDPTVINNADGRMQLLTRATDNTLWSVWQTAPNGNFSSWLGLGGSCYGVPAAGKNADGRLQVFTRAGDNTLWTIWQTSPNGGFSGWLGLGGSCADAPAVGKNADGRLQVFTRATDNTAWTIWQTAPNGNFSGWLGLGGSCYSGPAVGKNADGRLQVFTHAGDNTVWAAWQTAANGSFTAWSGFGGSCQAAPSVGYNADGRMQIFTRATDNTVWTSWQTAVNGNWNAWLGLGN